MVHQVRTSNTSGKHHDNSIRLTVGTTRASLTTSSCKSEEKLTAYLAMSSDLNRCSHDGNYDILDAAASCGCAASVITSAAAAVTKAASSCLLCGD